MDWRPGVGLLVTVVLLGAGGVLAGCVAADDGKSIQIAMAPLHAMPMDVQRAPAEVQDAYRFAVANPAVLAAVPCYCGCGALGHRSSYDCYVAAVDDAGAITYDPHALYCQICVDITQDTLRMSRAGRAADEIRVYIDEIYSRYGKSNMP